MALFAIIACIPSVRHAAPRKWSPLEQDWWKVNFDGTMSGESEEIGVGVIVRNFRGEVKTALAEKISKPPSIDVLELLVAK
nr:hypothetical protein CFP56_57524 [Quercus suber]